MSHLLGCRNYVPRNCRRIRHSHKEKVATEYRYIWTVEKQCRHEDTAEEQSTDMKTAEQSIDLKTQQKNRVHNVL